MNMFIAYNYQRIHDKESVESSAFLMGLHFHVSECVTGIV